MMKGIFENLPLWAREVAQTYRSGVATLFMLHGNVFDFVPARDGDNVEFLTLRDFLADSLFPQRSAVIFYDPSGGITFRSESAREDFHSVAKAAAATGGRMAYDYTLPRDPYGAIRAIEQYLRSRVIAPEKRGGVAIIIEYAQTICPMGEFAHMSAQETSTLVTLLKWANDPTLMRADVTVCLITENLADMHTSLVTNPFVQKVRIDLPDDGERNEFIGRASKANASRVDFIADRTAGLSRINIRQILSHAQANNEEIDGEYLAGKKKDIIERECYGLLEFIEPKFRLDMVSGHEAAKRWLREDAKLLKDGHLSALPMGYLICGPVGTGKSFLVTCAAGEIGIPLVRMKNFRSKWVGATEGNLEKILGTLKSLGPVGVVVDEADAALGSRRAAGDSGVSSRVFGMIAEQMGDTAYRGKILWFLITARPDLLPIDLKRQGRAEVHIPLFYPDSPAELLDMVKVVAAKNGAPIADPSKLKAPPDKTLSGSDIEAIVIRANRQRLLDGKPSIGAGIINDELTRFMPRVNDAELKLQTLAAVYECTHPEFLPQRHRALDRFDVLSEILTLKRNIGES